MNPAGETERDLEATMRIDPRSTLFEITEQWPQTIPVFVAQGFEQMNDPGQRQTFGRLVSLEQAARTRSLDLDALVDRLSGCIDDDRLARRAASPARELSVVGLLPCPVRIPLLEAFEPWAADYTRRTGSGISHELQAASMGAAWIEENLKTAREIDDLPDLFISAGFETFFDPEGLGRFRPEFYDGIAGREMNPTFARLGLEDPEGHYSVIAVVPAVFMVNMKELGDLPVPRSWEEILDPRYEQRVSLPVGDFDLFSSILLDVQQRYGDDALRRLGRSLSTSMHPAQMIKLGRKPSAPIVTIMPYFFTKMAKPGGPMQAVWPADGAIVSPIFLLAKSSRRESVQPLVEFFASKKIGEILSHQGLFPSTHPEIDNRLEEDRKFSWLGWDYIHRTNLREQMAAAERLFDEGRQG